MKQTQASRPVEFLPSSPRQALDQTRGAVTVMAVGAMSGAAVGVGIVSALMLISQDTGWWLIAVLFAAIIGAFLGGTVGPVVAWALLRTVPLRAIIAWSAVGTIAGFEVGVARNSTEGALVGAVLGFVFSAIVLHAVNRMRCPLGNARAIGVAAIALSLGGIAAGRLGDRQLVLDALKLSRLPSSVRIVGCRSDDAFRDPSTDCGLTFDSADLPKLLAGRPFKRTQGADHWIASDSRYGITLHIDPSHKKANLTMW